MQALRFDIAVGDASAVCSIREDNGDSLPGPFIAFSCLNVACMQSGDNFTCASALQVFAEDHTDDFSLAVIDDERFFSFATTSVSIRGGAGAVSALLDRAELAAFDFGSMGKPVDAMVCRYGG